MSGIGLLQPDVCEVQLSHDHVQPHQHVQGDHPKVLGHLEVQMVDHVKILKVIAALS